MREHQICVTFEKYVILPFRLKTKVSRLNSKPYAALHCIDHNQTAAILA